MIRKDRLKDRNKYGYLNATGVYKMALPFMEEPYKKLREKGDTRIKPYYDKFWKVVRTFLTIAFNDALDSRLGINLNHWFGRLYIRKKLVTWKPSKTVPKNGYFTYFRWVFEKRFANNYRLDVAKKWKRKLWHNVFVEGKEYLDDSSKRDLFKTA